MDFATYYAGEAECVAATQDYFDAYIRTYGEGCADAFFDMNDCYARLDCSELNALETKCADVIDAWKSACPEARDDGSVSAASSSLRALRIPR
jgi:hypothetical protein